MISYMIGISIIYIVNLRICDNIENLSDECNYYRIVIVIFRVNSFAPTA